MSYTAISYMKRVNTFPLPFKLFFVRSSDIAIIAYKPATVYFFKKTGFSGRHFLVTPDGTICESLRLLTVF